MNQRLIFVPNLAIKLSAIAILTCCLCLASAPTIPPVVAKSPGWLNRSNEYAELLERAIEAQDCKPKPTLDANLLEINPTYRKCRRQGILQVVRDLEQKQTEVKNEQLRLDLSILLKFGRQTLLSDTLDAKYAVSYVNLSQAILNTLRSTLNESQSKSQVLKQLQDFVGQGDSKTSLVEFVEQDIEIQLQQSEFILPSKNRLQNELKYNAQRIYKIQAFLKQQKIPNYDEAYKLLKQQLFDYETFIRQKVLTQKQDFRLPREVYALRLQRQGIEISIEELIATAHKTFDEVQQQMQAMAPKIAQRKKLKANDYRAVIRALQQERLSPQATLRLYQKRARDLDKIIQRQNIVTLPQTKFNLRLATVRENQTFPVPLYDPSTNTFVIPALRNPQQAKLYNDFTNPAMSWTLTAHEGRPGHDLQFAIVKQQNLSSARTEFASNAVGVEGWATYAEKIMLPHMPLEGQFMSLQFQLLRAARAFLEPELQLGKITTAEALKTITQDAGFSQFFAQQEIKRYTKTFVGQAPTYFYGSQQFLELRSQVEQQQGKRFDPQKFHDLILSQGYLTPKLLKKVIIDY